MNNEQTLPDIQPHLRSVKMAYLLLFLTGGFGAHRMYLGRWISALGYLGLFVLAMFSLEPLVLLASAVWWCTDLILLPGLTKKCNEALELEFKQHPERFAHVDETDIAPWARNKKEGMMYLFHAPARVAAFIILPALYTFVMVITANYEFIVFPVIILLASGLVTSLDKIVVRHPSLIEIPGLESALKRVIEMRQYYWNNEPKLGSAWFRMFTRAGTEYAPYWKIIGIAVFAITVEATLSFSDNYSPHLGITDAVWIITGHVVIMVIAILMILSPLRKPACSSTTTLPDSTRLITLRINPESGSLVTAPNP